MGLVKYAIVETTVDAAACELLCHTGLPDELPYHHEDCPVAKGLRDCWGTPIDLTSRLPRFTLDPCSNPRSTVQATRHMMLEEPTQEQVLAGWEQGNGLHTSWKNRSVFINGPFSDLLPWARKTCEARAFMFLANNATTTKWYRELVSNGGVYKFEFSKRLKFVPPPRIRSTTNNRDQMLVCNREGWEMIGNRLVGMGRWWVDYAGYLNQAPS
jgi:hypothetical protein